MWDVASDTWSPLRMRSIPPGKDERLAFVLHHAPAPGVHAGPREFDMVCSRGRRRRRRRQQQRQQRPEDGAAGCRYQNCSNARPKARKRTIVVLPALSRPTRSSFISLSCGKNPKAWRTLWHENFTPDACDLEGAVHSSDREETRDGKWQRW